MFSQQLMSCGHRRHQSEFEEIIYPKKSLVKYETPRLVIHDEIFSCPTTSPHILDILFPPIEFFNKTNHKYISCVSRQVATVADVIRLEEQFNHRLQTSHALEIGLCQIRRQIYDQCFDELLRQVTLECAERGILLYRIRNTFRQMMNSYLNNYISANAYAMRVILLNETFKSKLNKQIQQLEFEINELRKQQNQVEDNYENILKLYSTFQLTNESRFQTMIPFELQQLRTANKNLKQDLENLLQKKLDFNILEQINKKITSKQ